LKYILYDSFVPQFLSLTVPSIDLGWSFDVIHKRTSLITWGTIGR